MRLLAMLALSIVVACDGGKSDEPDDSDDTVDDTDDTPEDSEDTPEDSEDTPDDSEDTPEDSEDTPDDTEDTPDVGDDADGDGSADADDCVDDDPAIFPGAPELCDGVDQNCVADGESGRASFHPIDGTAAFDITTELSTGGSAVLASPGDVHLCGGSWNGTLTIQPGLSLNVTPQVGYSRPQWTGGAIRFNGDGSLRGVDLDGTALQGAPDAALHIDDVEMNAGNVLIGPGAEVEISGLTATGAAQWYLFGLVNDSLDKPPVTMSIEDSTFTDTATTLYGRIAAEVVGVTFAGTAAVGSPIELTLIDSTVDQGALYLAGDGTRAATLRNVTFARPQQTVWLAGLTDLTMEHVSVTGNGAAQTLVIQDIPSVLLDDVDVTTPSGEAISLSAPNGGLVSVSASGLDVAGGGVVAMRSRVEALVADSHFDGGLDACINASDVPALTIRNSTFNGCDAGPVNGGVSYTASGGGVSFVSASGSLLVEGSSFVDNSAGGSSGAILFRGSGSLTVRDTVFDGNHAGANGGAVELIGGTAAFEGCVFEDNTSVWQGSAIHVSAATTTISGGRMWRNVSDQAGGGAVHVQESTTLTDVDLGADGNDNAPTDISWLNGSGTWQGASSLVCTRDGCVAP